ncbi:MAG: alpha/beta hydrolase, partial [Limisphaerales bacterium]
GLSQGRPSEEGTYRDARAAFEWLQRKGLRQIIAYGESLGGGVASELCLHEETAGLILQSTFTSIPDIGAELFPWLPVRLLARIRYETKDRLARIKVPILVMHSREDGLIGFQHGERNFAAANQPKLFCELKGGHNEPLADVAAFRGGIEGFLRLISLHRGTSKVSG